MKRVTFAAVLVLASCRAKGEGTNIPEEKACIGLSDRSTCTAGLFCDTSRSFPERVGGNTWVKYGLCTKMRNVGEPRDGCHPVPASGTL